MGLGARPTWEAVVLHLWRGKRTKWDGSGESLPDRDRKIRAEADLAEMERDEQAGKLLDADSVRKTWSEECANMRGRLLSVPASAGVRIEDGMTLSQREEIIREGIYQALHELSGAPDA